MTSLRASTSSSHPLSRYLNIEKEIATRVRDENGTTRMEPKVFAEKVVGDVLGGANWLIWKRGYASVAHFLTSWVPIYLFVSSI